MIYEIFTYGGGDYIVEVLNSIVRIMGGNSFVTALKLSLLFGLFATFFDIAINGDFTKSAKYYITFLIAYNVLFLPKVDVIITDPINQIRTDRKVDNVPFGLAFMGHTISTLGNWMTETFGMNFALPNDLQYNQNGILFGATLIKDTFTARISNERTSSNFSNYVKQCIIPAIILKNVNTEQLIKSDSIQDFLNLGKNGVLAYNYVDENNQDQITLCSKPDFIQKDIEAEIQIIYKNQENKLNQSGNLNLNEVNNYIMGLNQSITKTFEQSLISNMISKSTQEYLSSTGASAGAISYAITKDDLQKQQNGAIQWLQSGKFLPLLKIVIEVMFYALFPIVVLLMMLPKGLLIFKSYIFILISLQIWSPLYAILNLIMTLEQKYRLNSIIAQTGGTISLLNKQAIIDITSNIQTQAGIFAMSIPILATKITSGMQNFGESMISNVAGANSYSASNIASEVSYAGLSYGNSSFKNTSWGNENFNNVSGNKKDTNITDYSGIKRSQGSDGIITTTTDSGSMYDTTMNRSNTGVSANFSENLENSLHIAVANSQTNAKNKSNTLNETITRMNNSYRENNDNSTTWGVDSRGEVILKTRGGFQLLGNGVTVEGVVSGAIKAGYDERTAKQLGNEFSLIKNQQKSYTESLNEASNYQKSLDYVTRTGANISRELTDEMFNKKRSDGISEEEIKSLANNREILAQELQTYSFDKFNINKPTMYNNHNNSTKQFQNSYNDVNFDNEYNQKLNEVKEK